ncbi:MAG: class I SAM-dependent methyltransferase [bacterium]|nr:class I SAM-dependent methyltransferase [bacterium]
MSRSEITPSYSDLADWWQLWSHPSEYIEEAAFYSEVLTETAEGKVSRLLELGSGGGNNASHMKAGFRLTLVDLSPAMLRQSQLLNPECEHQEGDMRTLRLGRKFDAVFVHDAASYLASEEDLKLAAKTAFIHCRSGGAVLFAPDHIRESFKSGTSHGGHDSEGRGLRCLEWHTDPDPTDDCYVCDFVFVLRETDGSVRVVHDQHTLGMLSLQQWLDALKNAGFEARTVPCPASEAEGFAGVIFVGKKP